METKDDRRKRRLAQLCAGCAQVTVWEKPSAWPQNFDLDSRECRERAFSRQGRPFEQSVAVYEECLHRRGWSPSKRWIAG